jgi:hypothetical protein
MAGASRGRGRAAPASVHDLRPWACRGARATASHSWRRRLALRASRERRVRPEGSRRGARRQARGNLGGCRRPDGTESGGARRPPGARAPARRTTSTARLVFLASPATRGRAPVRRRRSPEHRDLGAAGSPPPRSRRGTLCADDAPLVHPSTLARAPHSHRTKRPPGPAHTPGLAEVGTYARLPRLAPGDLDSTPVGERAVTDGAGRAALTARRHRSRIRPGRRSPPRCPGTRPARAGTDRHR